MERLSPMPDGAFEAVAGSRRLRARKVLLATGARDVEPDLPGLAPSLKTGHVRYCPVCDGYETKGQRVAVLGKEIHGLRESVFVAGFGNQVTWLSMALVGSESESSDCASWGAHRRVRASRTPRSGKGVVVEMHDGQAMTFDMLYPALGLTHASELAVQIGARAQEDGQLEVMSTARRLSPASTPQGTSRWG